MRGLSGPEPRHGGRRARHGAIAVASVLVALTLASPANAAGRRVPFSATVRAAAIDFSGSEFVFTGEFTSRRLGHGSVVYTTRGSSVTGRRSAKLRFYTPLGRINAQTQSIFVENSDGTVTNDGTGVITGGTGRYRDVYGWFIVLATLDPNTPDKTTFFMKEGTLVFPPVVRAPSIR